MTMIRCPQCWGKGYEIGSATNYLTICRLCKGYQFLYINA